MAKLTREDVERIVKEATERRKGEGSNLVGADLSEADLVGVDLGGVDLNRANLSGADLGGARLYRTNLYRANLSGTDLKEADLNWANLSWATLSGASLIRANLRGAELFEAGLSGANLSEANLSWAKLTKADLSGAKLNEADLSGANLIRTNLNRADLSGAKLGSTVFADVELGEVKGLDTVEHRGPSTLGLDTISKSKGNLPDIFLRGCGIPENFITYLPSLASQAGQYYSCFISYSHKDEAFARRLHADLQNKGVRCWYAPEDMKIGGKLRPTIDRAIRVHDKLLLVLSEHSVASSWVEAEIETMLEREDEQGQPALFPIRLDNTVLEVKFGWAAQIRRSRHIGDFSAWKDHDAYQASFERLLRDLRAEANL